MSIAPNVKDREGITRVAIIRVDRRKHKRGEGGWLGEGHLQEDSAEAQC